MKLLSLGTGEWKRRPEVSGAVPFQEPDWTHYFVFPYSLPDETPSSDEEHHCPVGSGLWGGWHPNSHQCKFSFELLQQKCELDRKNKKTKEIWCLLF